MPIENNSQNSQIAKQLVDKAKQLFKMSKNKHIDFSEKEEKELEAVKLLEESILKDGKFSPAYFCKGLYLANVQNDS